MHGLHRINGLRGATPPFLGQGKAHLTGPQALDGACRHHSRRLAAVAGRGCHCRLSAPHSLASLSCVSHACAALR